MDTESRATMTESPKKPSSSEVQHLEELMDDGNSIPTSMGSSWAWVVLFSSFACTAIVDGLIFSFGLHILEMMESASFFGLGNTEPSFLLYLLPGGLLGGMHLYASPLANVLSNQFDCRPVAMASAVFSGLVLVGSAFLENLKTFALLFGICGGLSCGLLYFPSLSIVAQWFESRRALAVGLAICGSGVGTCAMSLCMSSAVGRFTWRGVLIIYGAVFIQLSVVIALFRPVKVQQVIKALESTRRSREEVERLQRRRILAIVRREKLRRASGQASRRRKSSAKRGRIWSRIMEEKFRQISSSTGSLDGMVITRDNELISLPSEACYSMAKAAAVAYAAAAAAAGATSTNLSPPALPQPTNSNPATFASSTASVDRPSSLRDAAPGRELVTTPLPNPRPLVLSTTSRDFSRSGVIRIADAILQKLEAQAVIAPGMRCPDMTDVFKKLSSGSHHQPVRGVPSHAGVGEEAEGHCTHSHPPKFCSVHSEYCSLPRHSHLSSVRTESAVRRPLSTADKSTAPTVCISVVDSTKAGSVNALDIGTSDQSSARLQVTPTQSMSRSSSGSSIDPKTDRAISRELSRVCLDPTLKARIRSVIYQKLKRSGQLKTRQRNQRHPDETEPRDLAHEGSDRSLDSAMEVGLESATPTTRDGERAGGQSTVCPTCGCKLAAGARPADSQNNTKSLWLFVTRVRDYLDLQLLVSPSFLLFSLACTLHMFAFFAPYHVLPLYLSLDVRRLPCSQRVWSSPFGPSLQLSQGFVSVSNIIFTVGFGHLIGRLIATFYIDHILGVPKAKRSTKLMSRLLDRLSDPMVSNVVALVIGGAALLLVPLSMRDVCPKGTYGIVTCECYIPLRAALYTLVFGHTVASAFAISLRSVIAVELIGVHHLTPAFVYLLVFQGTGAVAGPLVVGLISEAASGVKIGPSLLSDTSYLLTSHPANPLNWCFYTCGLVFLCSALAYTPLRRLAAWEARRYLAARRRPPSCCLCASATPADTTPLAPLQPPDAPSHPGGSHDLDSDVKPKESGDATGN
uniref:Pecanex-like protein n=3 Tax=Mesocestoides corti TaxID=53468 RepID=A0A5K3EMT2_MESCO